MDESFERFMQATSERALDTIARIEAGDNPAIVAYAVWMDLTRYLAAGGKTAEELSQDAARFAVDWDVEGRA